ncbi:hypothetical protein [Methanothermococcus thermolithotrophicus]|uniref:hypothetical protein n=1 Tax=Methanothermococcus thermolithotrophicus TaxID=2186 RepID=UPI0012F6B228|nr:hypothetical protein [Methanothermococcus thermolithotrophicus]
MESAISNIHDAYEVIGGRTVLIEALNNEKLIKFCTKMVLNIFKKDWILKKIVIWRKN